MQITSQRTIEAPVERVFDTIANIQNFSKAIPHVKSVTILSEIQSGVGTRFSETRVMNGREAVTELEVTELEPNQHVRLVSDTAGTVWDTVFRVAPTGDSTSLTMTMEARPYKLAAKMAAPLMKGMLSKALESDMDAVKSYCESGD